MVGMINNWININFPNPNILLLLEQNSMLFDAIYRIFTGPFPDTTTEQDEVNTMRFMELEKNGKYGIVQVLYYNSNPWVVVCQPGDIGQSLDSIYANGWKFSTMIYKDTWCDAIRFRSHYEIVSIETKSEGK